jgi:Cdc6-like AAA superfamily ATPase
MENTITLGEFKDTFKYLIQNNFRLIDRGIAPISVGIEGPCGIGKTSIIEEIAKELGMTYVRIGLSELEEVGDLCGMPLKEFEVHFSDCPSCPKWVSTDILNNIHKEFEFTGASRMSYASPA